MDDEIEQLSQRILATPDMQAQIALDTALTKALVREWMNAHAMIGRQVHQIERIQDELAFQAKNAADAHAERAHQFRRVADTLESLAGLLESYDLVLRMVPPLTADVIRGAFVGEIKRAREMVDSGGSTSARQPCHRHVGNDPHCATCNPDPEC